MYLDQDKFKIYLYFRWQNPINPKPWTPTVYDATFVRPGCPQNGCKDMNPALVCPDKVAEDCLFLYIWTPLNANSSSNIPVMVYIHGGNFVHMSAGSLLFDGENLANKGQVIIINVEYRLGALGFLLTKDTQKGKGATGNYAILDQQQALRWIYENIKGFGGDPEQITLFGQSAGAQSTVVHLMNKESSKYFKRAIIESAPVSIPFKDKTEMLFIGNLLADQLNCPEGDLTCLTSKTAEEIAEAQHITRPIPSSLKLLEFFEPWVPYVDGDIVPYQPLEAMRRGLFTNKPIMIGTVTEETRIYVYSAWSNNLTPFEYAAALAATFPSEIANVLELYPPPPLDDDRDALIVPATDYVFTCCTRGSTWLYVYDHAFSFPGWAPFNYCQGHVCHGSEIPILLRSWSNGNFTATPDEVALSEQLMIYWTNFAKSADPNTGLKSNLMWPKYTLDGKWPYMHFKTPADENGVNWRGKYCDFWDAVGYKA
ncbi:hypothetical protein FSP39_013279 [Pinctada imbricata]|uniref:Carboxylic ester hydrolase n=1 Tax=Pinctada imbricata TaxID=66713 RepID=A0AA89BXB5_PINIB|nr:hypothetical protein FSP39_013279 [Pinctada imbricata]